MRKWHGVKFRKGETVTQFSKRMAMSKTTFYTWRGKKFSKRAERNFKDRIIIAVFFDVADKSEKIQKHMVKDSIVGQDDVGIRIYKEYKDDTIDGDEYQSDGWSYDVDLDYGSGKAKVQTKFWHAGQHVGDERVYDESIGMMKRMVKK